MVHSYDFILWEDETLVNHPSIDPHHCHLEGDNNNNIIWTKKFLGMYFTIFLCILTGNWECTQETERLSICPNRWCPANSPPEEGCHRTAGCRRANNLAALHPHNIQSKTSAYQSIGAPPPLVTQPQISTSSLEKFIKFLVKVRLWRPTVSVELQNQFTYCRINSCFHSVADPGPCLNLSEKVHKQQYPAFQPIGRILWPLVYRTLQGSNFSVHDPPSLHFEPGMSRFRSSFSL